MIAQDLDLAYVAGAAIRLQSGYALLGRKETSDKDTIDRIFL